MSVTDFRAKCQSLLKEVTEHGGHITITKRGRPLATVCPAPKRAWKSSEGSSAGKVAFADDLAECEMAGLWEVVHESERESGAG